MITFCIFFQAVFTGCLLSTIVNEPYDSAWLKSRARRNVLATCVLNAVAVTAVFAAIGYFNPDMFDNSGPPFAEWPVRLAAYCTAQKFLFQFCEAWLSVSGVVESRANHVSFHTRQLTPARCLTERAFNCHLAELMLLLLFPTVSLSFFCGFGMVLSMVNVSWCVIRLLLRQRHFPDGDSCIGSI